MPPDPRIEDLLERQGIAAPDEPHTRALIRILADSPDATLPAQLPAPLPPDAHYPEGRLSPRMLLLLAKALDTHKQDTVRLEGAPLGLLACLLMELPGAQRPERIVLVSPRPIQTRATVSRHLKRERAGAVTVEPLDPDPRTAPRRFSRHLQWKKRGVKATPNSGDDGLSIIVHLDPPLPTIHQLVRVDGTHVRFDLGSHVPRLETPSRDVRVPLRRLLAAECHHHNAFHGQTEGRLERLVVDSVDELFHAGPLDTADPAHERARFLFRLGYLEQLTASRSGAYALYRASLDTCQSAEAWTFMGWLHAQQGEMEDAIAACKNAIDTDRSLGNPFNDIGAYLFAMKRNEEAKTWFYSALMARRYVAPHYPYTNLARIHLQEGDLVAARRAAQNALETRNDYAPARRLMAQIETHSDSLER